MASQVKEIQERAQERFNKLDTLGESLQGLSDNVNQRFEDVGKTLGEVTERTDNAFKQAQQAFQRLAQQTFGRLQPISIGLNQQEGEVLLFRRVLNDMVHNRVHLSENGDIDFVWYVGQRDTLSRFSHLLGSLYFDKDEATKQANFSMGISLFPTLLKAQSEEKAGQLAELDAKFNIFVDDVCFGITSNSEVGIKVEQNVVIEGAACSIKLTTNDFGIMLTNPNGWLPGFFSGRSQVEGNGEELIKWCELLMTPLQPQELPKVEESLAQEANLEDPAVATPILEAVEQPKAEVQAN